MKTLKRDALQFASWLSIAGIPFDIDNRDTHIVIATDLYKMTFNTKGVMTEIDKYEHRRAQGEKVDN